MNDVRRTLIITGMWRRLKHGVDVLLDLDTNLRIEFKIVASYVCHIFLQIRTVFSIYKILQKTIFFFGSPSRSSAKRSLSAPLNFNSVVW